MVGLAQLAARPRLNPIEPRAIPTYVILIIAWGLVTGTFALTRFSYDGDLNYYYAQVVVLLVSSMALRYLSLPRIAGCIEVLTLKIAISASAAMGSAMLAATALPLVDSELIQWDAILGFDWIALMNILSNHPILISIFYGIYPTLTFQMFLIVPALFLAKQELRCWTFVLAWGLALACSMTLFPLYPAVGPIVFHEFQLPGIPFKNDHMDVFLAVRDGSLRELGAATIRGMVTFPSFHVAGAVLLGWAAVGLRILRWPFFALNAIMLVSAIPIGGHYLVDVIAGAVIAMLAIIVARIILSMIGATRRTNDRRRET